MDINTRLINMIEDNALKDDFLIQLSISIIRGLPLPRYVPRLNDGVMTEVLSNILEYLNAEKKLPTGEKVDWMPLDDTAAKVDWSAVEGKNNADGGTISGETIND